MGGGRVNAPVEAISLQGGVHNLLTNGMAAMALQFFGLTGGTTHTGNAGAVA